MKKYLTMLAPEAKTDHKWNANEERGRGTHNGAVRLSANPVTFNLTWASNAASPSRYIGTYQLHLRELCEDGYIATDRQPGHVRVRFVNVGGVIRLARGKKTKRYLVVGEFPNQ